MYYVRIEIAKHVFEIRTLYLRDFEVFRVFITDREPEIRICMTDVDIDNVKKDFERHYTAVTNWNGYYEYYAILRRISDELINYSVLLMHGAAISYQGQVYLFTAPSGVGKTTHIQKWIKQFPDSIVVNGDKPFILVDKANKKCYACGSPWAGKENMYSNVILPLKAIITMKRDEYNSIKSLSFKQVFPELMQQIYHPLKSEGMREALELLQYLHSSVSFWDFRFNNYREDCLKTAYEALTGNYLDEKFADSLFL